VRAADDLILLVSSEPRGSEGVGNFGSERPGSDSLLDPVQGLGPDGGVTSGFPRALLTSTALELGLATLSAGVDSEFN
jgi:hypothetical protein